MIFDINRRDAKYSIEVIVNDLGHPTGARLINKTTQLPIPKDEPIFILRAKDINALPALEAYLNSYSKPDYKDVDKHINAIKWVIDGFISFCKRHPDKMKNPDS